MALVEVQDSDHKTADPFLPGSYSLAVLREKQIKLVKHLKFLRKSKPKIVFADCEIQINLETRSPDKEKLLFLHAENKRYQEKCFFGDIDSKKCSVMSEFYSNHKDILNDISDNMSSFHTNVELERYLTGIKDDLSKDLHKALATYRKHQQSLAEKYREVQRLTSDIIRAKEKSRVNVMTLKEKFYKGVALQEDEIVQLSLNKCQDTNMKLTSAVELHGKQLDSYREQFLLKRDALVSDLASEHEKGFGSSAKPTNEVEESDDKSNPPSLVGSQYDVLVEHDQLAGAMAKISRNTEQLTKYYYKLNDLKSRFEESLRMRRQSTTSGFTAPTVVSNIHATSAHNRRPE